MHLQPTSLAFSLALFALPAYGRAFGNLPENPEPQSTSAQVQADQPPQAGTGTVSGTVLDSNGDVIQGARVELSKAGAAGAMRNTSSNSTGGFEFPGLEPGTYTIKVTGRGMTSFVSNAISLSADETFVVPKVMLAVSGGSTSVTVMDEKQASIQQVQIAEQQRVFGVFPNFYSSFDWNAPPMLAKQKFHLATRTLTDPVTFVVVGGLAGAEQYKNVFPSFGGGIEGYGKRYGAAYANHASSELLTRAVFPAIFHDDPRYFVMGKGSTRERSMHAISSTFVTRGDNGSRKPNYSQLFGSFTSAALSNAYFPAQERGAHLVMINGFGELGGNIVDNLIREFVLNRLTSRASSHHH